MGSVITSFKRYEKKYLLDREQYNRFRETVDKYMQVDEYGLNTICNLYYDTYNYELIRESIEKPVYKEKLRLRSYGTPEASSMVYLEVKKKCNGVVYKRREGMLLTEAYECIADSSMQGRPGQIANEIDYVLKKYKPVPKVYLAYDRIAMYGKSDPELRMTFDFDMRARSEDLYLEHGDYGEHILDEDKIMLEIKVEAAYPFWLIKLLEECEVYPVSFSKYGTVYSRRLWPEFVSHNKIS